MNNEKETLSLSMFILGFLIGFFVWFWVGVGTEHYINSKIIENWAIEHEYAHYNSKTAELVIEKESVKELFE